MNSSDKIKEIINKNFDHLLQFQDVGSFEMTINDNSLTVSIKAVLTINKTRLTMLDQMNEQLKASNLYGSPTSGYAAVVNG
jgi:hypothetical protein